MTPKLIQLSDESWFAIQSINYEEDYYVGFPCDAEGQHLDGPNGQRGLTFRTPPDTSAAESAASAHISAALGLT